MTKLFAAKTGAHSGHRWPKPTIQIIQVQYYVLGTFPAKVRFQPGKLPNLGKFEVSRRTKEYPRYWAPPWNFPGFCRSGYLSNLSIYSLYIQIHLFTIIYMFLYSYVFKYVYSTFVPPAFSNKNHPWAKQNGILPGAFHVDPVVLVAPRVNTWTQRAHEECCGKMLYSTWYCVIFRGSHRRRIYNTAPQGGAPQF